MGGGGCRGYRSHSKAENEGGGGGGGGLTEEWVRRQIEPLDELQTMKAVR